MATSCEDRSFVVVTAARQKLNTETIRISKQGIEEAKQMVTDEMGEETMLELPEEEDD